MVSRKPKTAKPAPQIVDEGAFIASTVTQSDVYAGQYRRVPNTLLGQRLDLCYGPAAVWAKLNATACSNVRVRLYRDGGPGKPVSKSRRLYLESGRAGRKAAEWASDADGLVEVTEHPLLDVLHRPNQMQSGHAFQFHRYYMREATGNAFVQVETSDVGVSLYNLNPRWVQVVPSVSAFIAGYRYGREDSIVHEFEPGQVFHYMLIGGENPYYGDTWVTDVAEAINVLKANYSHNDRFIRSGMFPPFMLKVTPQTTATQIDDMRHEMDRHYAGVSKWTRPMILRNAEPHMLPAEPRAYQTVEQLEAFRRDIRNAAGVPESMADVNSANLASAVVGFDRHYIGVTIAPRVQLMCADDTHFLVPLFGEEPGRLFFAMDEIVAADDAAMLQRHTASVGRWATVNEARAEWGMEALPGHDAIEGGVPTQDAEAAAPLPVEQAAEPVAAAVPNAGLAVDIVSRVASGELPRDAGVAMLGEFFRLDPSRAEAIMGSAGTGARTEPNIPAGQQAATPNATPEPTAPPDMDEKARPCCEGKAISAVNLSPAGEKAASALEAALRKWYEQYGALASVSATGEVIMAAEAEEALRALLRPAIQDLMEAGVADAGGLGSGEAFTPKVPESYVVELAQTIKRSTQDALTGAIRAGVEGGASIDELHRMVAEAAPQLSGDAAYRIARTEGAYASEAGRHQLDVANGATHHEWELASGGCPVCSEFAATYGQKRPINEPYAPAGTTIAYTDDAGNARTLEAWRDVLHPPLHPHCRCRDKTVEVRDEVV